MNANSYMITDYYGPGQRPGARTPVQQIETNVNQARIYNLRNGQVRSFGLERPEVNQMKYNSIPRDIAPLPKASLYHLDNKSEPSRAWKTVKIVEKKVEMREPAGAKLKVYSINKARHPEKAPTPPPRIPQYRIYAINEPSDDTAYLQRSKRIVQYEERGNRKVQYIKYVEDGSNQPAYYDQQPQEVVYQPQRQPLPQQQYAPQQTQYVQQEPQYVQQTTNQPKVVKVNTKKVTKQQTAPNTGRSSDNLTRPYMGMYRSQNANYSFR